VKDNALEFGQDDADARHTRRARRLLERRLPAGLRGEVGRVRRDDLATSILGGIFDWVRRVAEREDLLRSYPAILGRTYYVPAAHERRILRELEANRAFRGKVRREVQEHLRTAHITRSAPPVLAPAHLGAAPRSQEGTLVLRSTLGLRTGSLLEAEPEECNVYVHDRLLREWRDRDLTQDLTLDDGAEAHVLVFGAGAGGFARVVESRGSRFPRVVVHERDPLAATRTDLPCVTASALFKEAGSFDGAVVLLRSPGEGGAANHAHVYGDVAGDLSMVGPEAWARSAAALVRAIGSMVAPRSMVFVIASGSVRTTNGYRAVPEMLPRILRALEGAGLHLLEQHCMVELEPQNQPFVGRSRPDRWLLVSRAAGGPAA
jgi:hypothetical protein